MPFAATCQNDHLPTLSVKALGRPLARYDRSIDVHVSNLRHKLGTLADGRSPIQTVRGVGYQYITDDAPA